MSKFLETLNQKFDPDKELDLIVEYLIAMTEVNRFSLIFKMLDNKVKEGKMFIIPVLVKRVLIRTLDFWSVISGISLKTYLSNKL